MNDKVLPDPVRIKDVAEFLGAPVMVVRIFVNHLYPDDPMPIGNDRLQPIEAQSIVAAMRGLKSGNE